jgi:hypothetical protein
LMDEGLMDEAGGTQTAEDVTPACGSLLDEISTARFQQRLCVGPPMPRRVVAAPRRHRSATPPLSHAAQPD